MSRIEDDYLRHVSGDRQVSETPDPGTLTAQDALAHVRLWLVTDGEPDDVIGWIDEWSVAARPSPAEPRWSDEPVREPTVTIPPEWDADPIDEGEAPAEPPHDLRSRWSGNTGPMWCHTHDLPAAHAVPAESRDHTTDEQTAAARRKVPARQSPAEPPSEPCPFCGGAGCPPCRGRGTVGPAFRANRGLPPYVAPAEPPAGDLRETGFVPSRGYLVAGDARCRTTNLGDRCVNAKGHASSHQFVPGCAHPAEARWWVVRAEVCGTCGATTGTDRGEFERLRAALRDPALAAEDREPLRKALDLADARLSTLLGNTDSHDPALVAIRKARLALKTETPEPTALDVAIDAVAAALDAVDQTLDGLPDTNPAHETIDALGLVAKAWNAFIEARLATVRSTTPPEPEDGGT